MVSIKNWMTIPCSIYRGGTSKAILVRGKDLPSDPQVRDAVIVYLFGSPDSNQINGLGGSTPTTSKLAIVERSDRNDADVDYTFGQVSIDSPFVDYRPNCGNISSAVGPFAVQQGLVEVDGDFATVRIFNTNTNSLIVARFPVQERQFYPDGDTVIPGVPGTASQVQLDFLDVGGGTVGSLLPTGNVTDTVSLVDGRTFTYTALDAGNLTVFMDADELGINGDEITETSIQRHGSVLETLELIRQYVGRQLGLYHQDEAVTASSHALPKIAVVQRPLDYRASTGQQIKQSDLSITARVLTMGRLHPAYAITGAVALVVAANIPDTVPFRKIGGARRGEHFLHIGHPSGILKIGAQVEDINGSGWSVKAVSVIRTARPIMEGQAWIPKNLMEPRA